MHSGISWRNWQVIHRWYVESGLTLIKHRTQDFAFILDGITNSLEQQLAVSNNLLPGSRKSVPYVPEISMWFVQLQVRPNSFSVVILLWKMVELNKVRFLLV